MFKKNLRHRDGTPPQEEFSTSSGDDNQPHDVGHYSDEEIYIEDEIRQKKDNSKPTSFLRRTLKGCGVALIGFAIFTAGRFFFSGMEVIPVSSAAISSQNNNKLVYLNGALNTADLRDQLFNLSFKGLALERVVEMYQWTPENEQYIKKWSEELIKITDEKLKSENIINPEELPLQSEKWSADKITIGSFVVSAPLLLKLGNVEVIPLRMGEENFKQLPPEGQLAFKLHDGRFFFGIDPEKPNIGDLRISFKISETVPVSIIAQQQVGGSLMPYSRKQGDIAIMRQGIVEIQALLKNTDLEGYPVAENISLLIACLVGFVGLLIVIGKNIFLKNHSRRSMAISEAQRLGQFEETIGAQTQEDDEFMEVNIAHNHKLDKGKDFAIEQSHVKDSTHISKIPETEKPQQNGMVEKNFNTPSVQRPLKFDASAKAIATEGQLQHFGNEDEFGAIDIEHNAYDFLPEQSLSMDVHHVENDVSDAAFDDPLATDHAPGLPGLDMDLPSMKGKTDFDKGKENSSAEILETPLKSDVYTNITEHTDSYLDRTTTDDYEKIPDNVDFLMEYDLEQENLTTASQQPTKNVNPAPFIDFNPEPAEGLVVPDRIEKNLQQDMDLNLDQKNLATASQKPIANLNPAPFIDFNPEPAEGLAIPDSIEENLQQDELYSNSGDCLTAVSTDIAHDIEYTEDLQNDVPKPPEQKNINKNNNNQDVVNESRPKLMPPPPDLESLMKYINPQYVQASEPEVHGFDLPPLPDDFDPNVEMPPPDSEENTLSTIHDNMEVEEFIPAGDDLDDPLITDNSKDKKD